MRLVFPNYTWIKGDEVNHEEDSLRWWELTGEVIGLHALVVGGTGMLRDVAIFLAQSGYHVSVIARKAERLNALAEEAKSTKGKIHPVSVDYRRNDCFMKEVERAKSLYGPIRLAVVWIHATAPESPYDLASHLNHTELSCDYYHVLGSSTANPSKQDESRIKRFRRYAHIYYHEVILGFILENNGSRWLTNREISQGVIEAIQAKAECTVVGVVEPWSMRP